MGRRRQVGDRLDIGGPRGSAVVPDDFDWYLLIGDEARRPPSAAGSRNCARGFR
jgi:NADPH-dependent ferric siderophore reductase